MSLVKQEVAARALHQYRILLNQRGTVCVKGMLAFQSNTDEIVLNARSAFLQNIVANDILAPFRQIDKAAIDAVE